MISCLPIIIRQMKTSLQENTAAGIEFHRFHACYRTPGEVSQILQYTNTQVYFSLHSLTTIQLHYYWNPYFTPGNSNLSFTQATFPSKLKLALILPALLKTWFTKKRPISNLNNINIILERLALSLIFPHISISPSFGLLQSVVCLSWISF